MSAGPVALLTSESAHVLSHPACASLRLVASDGVLKADDGAFLPADSAIHLTRRGRLVVTLMALVAVVGLALMLAASVDAAPPRLDHAITVSAGQTLSEVAAAQMPTLPISDAMARIQLFNDLSTFQVHAGQTLLIPEMP